MFKKWLIGLLATSSLVVAGCASQDAGDNSNGTEKTAETGPAVAINESVEHEGEPIEGGTLKVALVHDSPFQGVFSEVFSEEGYDGNLMAYSHEGLFHIDENYLVTDGGAANMSIDEENKIVTVKLRDNLKWSDGEPVTADDVIFSYEILASPEANSEYFDMTEMSNLEGVLEYRNGEADHISGLEKVDDQTVNYHMKEINMDIKYGGGGLWSEVLPKHYLEDIPVDELSASPQIRQKPVSFGPFRVKEVVEGESVEYEANEYYYRGRPKLDKIQLTRVPSTNIASALQNHQFDMVSAMPRDSYDQYKDIPGYDYLTAPALQYGFMGFKLGKWNADKGEVESDPNAKMANPKLRQAMGYALDNDAIGQRFNHGLTWNANSVIVPGFEDLHDKEQPGFYYDPEKAKQLLDEAGYEDVDGDGLRETPEGEKLQINIAMGGGKPTSEPTAQYYIQAWKEVGLDTQLTNGRLLDFQDLIQRIDSDDESVDVFILSWALGNNPKPQSFSRTTQQNTPRYATEESDQLLKAISSQEAYENDDYRREQYKKFQQYMVDDPAVIPLNYLMYVTPVNKSVKAYNSSSADTERTNWADVQLVSEEPLSE